MCECAKYSTGVVYNWVCNWECNTFATGLQLGSDNMVCITPHAHHLSKRPAGKTRRRARIAPNFTPATIIFAYVKGVGAG